MEREGSLPHSQASANYLYPGPAQSSPLLKLVSKIYFLSYILKKICVCIPRTVVFL